MQLKIEKYLQKGQKIVSNQLKIGCCFSTDMKNLMNDPLQIVKFFIKWLMSISLHLKVFPRDFVIGRIPKAVCRELTTLSVTINLRPIRVLFRPELLPPIRPENSRWNIIYSPTKITNLFIFQFGAERVEPLYFEFFKKRHNYTILAISLLQANMSYREICKWDFGRLKNFWRLSRTLKHRCD